MLRGHPGLLLLATWLVLAGVLPTLMAVLVPAESWPGFEPQPGVLLAWWLALVAVVTVAGWVLWKAARRGG